jgi:hypothetical protein
MAGDEKQAFQSAKVRSIAETSLGKVVSPLKIRA